MMFLIAQEGLFYGILPLIFGIIFLLAGYYTIGIIIIFISALLFLFFRYPDRTVEENSGSIYAPVDGRIVCIRDEFENDYIKGEVYRVSIFMSVFNVHINYAPVDGTVQYVKYSPGKFINAGIIGKDETNENNFIGILSGSTKIGVRQVAGWIARRIVCDCKTGDRVCTGKRFGLIKFGSRVDLFIPKDYTIQVKSGDVVRAGRTIIASYKEKK
jgi:phosphatidylserine decarboxylase